MTQSERLDFLLEYLLEEDKKYASISIPETLDEKVQLFERLMQMRPITSFSKEFRQVYTAYLQKEKEKSEVITVSDLTPIQPHFYLWKGNLKSLQTDAIVSKKADILEQDLLSGAARIEVENEYKSGQIIYASSPKTAKHAVTHQDYKDLSQSYWDALELARANRCRSIAIDASDDGDSNFPAEMAARIAVDTLNEYMRRTRRSFEVIFNVTKEEDYRIYHRLLSNS